MPRIKVDHSYSDPTPVATTVPVEVPVQQVKPPSEQEKPKAAAFTKAIEDCDPNGTNDILRAKSGSPTLSAFSAFPDAVRFEGEDDDETIILLLRAHVVTNVKWIAATLALILLPIILFPLLGSAHVLGSVGPGINLVVTLIWYIGTFTYAFVNFLSWYFNVCMVTNERVIDIDWYSVIYHKTDSTRISKIQEVGSDRVGVFASIFDYGNVHIQTSAEEQNFDFSNVPHADLVSKKIQELMELEEKQWETKPND
jgi:membrane protein YdbS with pleckstrin-like domain